MSISNQIKDYIKLYEADANGAIAFREVDFCSFFPRIEWNDWVLGSTVEKKIFIKNNYINPAKIKIVIAAKSSEKTVAFECSMDNKQWVHGYRMRGFAASNQNVFQIDDENHSFTSGDMGYFTYIDDTSFEKAKKPVEQFMIRQVSPNDRHTLQSIYNLKYAHDSVLVGHVYEHELQCRSAIVASQGVTIADGGLVITNTGCVDHTVNIEIIGDGKIRAISDVYGDLGVGEIRMDYHASPIFETPCFSILRNSISGSSGSSIKIKFTGAYIPFYVRRIVEKSDGLSGATVNSHLFSIYLDS